MIKAIIKLHLNQLWWWQRGRVRRYLIECLEIIQNDANDVEEVVRIVDELKGKPREILILCLRDCLNYVAIKREKLLARLPNPNN